ncbi:MAG: hypothetical protein EXS08_09250 [Planctomycetes bacterium]|nr:hypothetical protein [Planctomycetota bacterium]
MRAEGQFQIEETPVDEARHFEDAGRHAEAEALTAPMKSFTFVASRGRAGAAVATRTRVESAEAWERPANGVGVRAPPGAAPRKPGNR